MVIDEDPGYKKGRVKTSAEAIRTRAKIKEFGIKTLNEAKFKRLLGKAYTRKSSVAAKDVIAALREQSRKVRGHRNC